MNPRHALLTALVFGLTACGPAPTLLEPVQAHDVTGKPITIYQVKGTPPPPDPEQERAQIAHNGPYRAASYGRASGHPTYVIMPRPYGYPGYYGPRYYAPYKGPIRILGAIPIGPQGRGHRRR